MGDMEICLEELERKYFMLQMKDHWDNDDFNYARELREKIKKLREEKKDENNR